MLPGEGIHMSGRFLVWGGQQARILLERILAGPDLVNVQGEGNWQSG